MRKAVINARVFDGMSPELMDHATIVIEDNMVAEITSQPVSAEGFDEVIDAGGRVVIPGLTDAHCHLYMTGGAEYLDTLRIDEVAVRSTYFAKVMLQRGFTTIRDAGGMVYGLKECIDNGFAAGPRIFPSHAAISQTSGHADFRTNRAEVRTPFGHTSPSMRNGGMVLADGVTEVLRAVREQLFLGASQIKIMAGGGLSSIFDALFTTQYAPEEMKAACDAARDYGTYVMAHIYTNESMQRAAKAGVMSFEHATLINDETARMVGDMGIWICPCPQFNRTDGIGGPKSAPGRPKKATASGNLMKDGEALQTELIQKYRLNFVFGTDVFHDEKIEEEPYNRQIADFRWYNLRFGSLEGLRAATGYAHELFKLSTYQNPYPDGKIGLLEQGSFADLCIVEGNPLENLDLLSEPDNMKLVMKDGTVYKNIL